MSEHNREQVESLLRARADEVERALHAMRREGQGMVESELARVDNHPADLGTEMQEQEVDLTTEVFLEEEARRIEEARRALAEGRYGICVDCGVEIPAERLRAVPEAVRCVECQRIFEGKHRQSNRGPG
jgi:RNA polymerase-binding transcription factor DksA